MDRRSFLGFGAFGLVGLDNAASLLSSGGPSSHQGISGGSRPFPHLTPSQHDLSARAAPAAPLGTNPEGIEFPRTKDQEIAFEQANRDMMDSYYRRRQSGSIILGSLALRIESGFKVVRADENFRSFHVEPLINQAADLLDRGIRDRAQNDDLTAKAITLALEFGEYYGLDSIHREEEGAGICDAPANSSAADLAGTRSAYTGQQSTGNIYKWIQDVLFSYDEQNNQYNASRKNAWLNGILPYSFKGQVFADYTQQPWNGVPDTVSHWSIDAAERTSSHGLNVQANSMFAQTQNFFGLANSSNARLPGLQFKAEWDKANSGFMRRRTIVSRTFEDLKFIAATTPDGALNYSKRVSALKSRFQQDFNNAYARLVKVAEGLRDVYDFDLAGNPLPVNTTDLSFFDDCLLWSRKVMDWLVRVGRIEQNYVLPISLRKLTGAGWHDRIEVEEMGVHCALDGLSCSEVGTSQRP